MVNNKNNKKTSFTPKRRGILKASRRLKTKGDPIADEPDPKLDFFFLGLPNQEFKYKGKTAAKDNHKAVPHLEEDDDDDLMQAFKLRPMFHFGQMGREEAPDDYCTEIVDQLRQNNNSLIDEIKNMRKEAKEWYESGNKQMISAIKELQSELKKTIVEELPKQMKK